MSVGDMLAYVWSLMTNTGYHVFDVFVSYADIFVFVIIVSLLLWLVGALLGGE